MCLYETPIPTCSHNFTMSTELPRTRCHRPEPCSPDHPENQLPVHFTIPCSYCKNTPNLKIPSKTLTSEEVYLKNAMARYHREGGADNFVRVMKEAKAIWRAARKAGRWLDTSEVPEQMQEYVELAEYWVAKNRKGEGVRRIREWVGAVSGEVTLCDPFTEIVERDGDGEESEGWLGAKEDDIEELERLLSEAEITRNMLK